MKLSQQPSLFTTHPARLARAFFTSIRCTTSSFPFFAPLLSCPSFFPDGRGIAGNPFPTAGSASASRRHVHPQQEADVGTIVYRATKAQAIHDELTSVGAFATVLAHRAIGNRLWFLAEAKTGARAGRKWIGLTLIDCRNAEAAIKSMDEACGPCYYDCPLAFLAQADAPMGPYAGPWREKVRAFHASRSAKRAAVRPGLRISYGDHTYVLCRSLGRRGWDVARESDGLVFRLKSRQLGSATVLPSQKKQP